MSATRANASQKIYVGTAGWTIPTRHGSRVPGAGSHLERCARAFRCTEINSSFHRPHQRKTYERWAKSVPNEFRFAVKLPKTMSHEKRLADCGDLLDAFAEQVTGLGDKLAVLLLQTPPKAEFDRKVTAKFLRDLRKRFDAPVVVEPRHASWFTEDVDAWLAEHQIARVAADPAKNIAGDIPAGWPGLAYYRWHGAPRMYYSEYDADALAALQGKLLAHRAAGVPAWCIFDNTASGAALGNALDLSRSLNASAAA